MKTQPHPMKVAVVALSLGLLFTSTAWAGGSFNVGTSLTIEAPKNVHKQSSFTIDGKLESSKKKCRAHSKVQLVAKGIGVVGHDVTTRSGSYSFGRRIKVTTKFYTKFAGKVMGSHPNIQTCRKSTSKTVTVHVT